MHQTVFEFDLPAGYGRSTRPRSGGGGSGSGGAHAPAGAALGLAVLTSDPLLELVYRSGMVTLRDLRALLTCTKSEVGAHACIEAEEGRAGAAFPTAPRPRAGPGPLRPISVESAMTCLEPCRPAAYPTCTPHACAGHPRRCPGAGAPPPVGCRRRAACDAGRFRAVRCARAWRGAGCRDAAAAAGSAHAGGWVLGRAARAGHITGRTCRQPVYRPLPACMPCMLC